MRPRADEILHSVIATFDEYVAPDVTDPFAKSLTLTLSNLMRNVALRIEHEGQALFDDNAQLRVLLVDVRRYLEQVDAARFAAEVDEISTALEAERYAPGVYPSLALITEEATSLRWALQHAIRSLELARPDLEADDSYGALRRSIRGYLRSSIEREMQLIVPAFTGERR